MTVCVPESQGGNPIGKALGRQIGPILLNLLQVHLVITKMVLNFSQFVVLGMLLIRNEYLRFHDICHHMGCNFFLGVS